MTDEDDEDNMLHSSSSSLSYMEQYKDYGDNQGCINCGILVSGIRARGVSSEHKENMEMFSCSPT